VEGLQSLSPLASPLK